jgi:fucose 4-O-acetylase-like acetyltransferase
MLPLFAFLSGYVLGRPGVIRPREYFVRRTVGLMVPYLCWEVFYGLVAGPMLPGGLGGAAAYFGGTLANPHLEGRMWYLYVLWLALVLTGLLRIISVENPWVLGLSVAVVMIWPWWGAFKRLQWIYAYVVLGLLARRFEAAWLPRRATIGVIGAIAFVPLWLLTRPEQLALSRVNAWFGHSSVSSAAVAALYGLSTLTGVAAIAAIVSASYVMPFGITRSLAVPGRLSLGIYVSHFLFVEVWHEPSPWLIAPIVALALAGSMAVTVLLSRWRVTATLMLGERWAPKGRREAAEMETL